uniref:MFS domain-containing protein n=1 Tax=Caenorhabditis tropicalis TaxID=1561998 RepID=A0A1I7T6D5_9PELO
MNNFRFFLLFLATVSMTFVYSNRVVFGFTVICQQSGNETEEVTYVDPDYYLLDSLNVAWMFTATAIGMCLGPAPFYFAHFLSTRVLIFSYGFLSAISSILYPLADSLGFWPALVCRFLAGFAQASQLHFTNDLVLRWTPQSEASFFFSIMLATSQFGPLFTMILGGEMCSSSFLDGKPPTTFWDNLEESEKKYILAGKHSTNKKDAVPYKELLKDWTIWISLLMFTGYYLAMIVYQQYSPIFIKQVLHFTIRETGYFSAIPQFIAIFIKIGCGRLLDVKFGCGPKLTLVIPLLILESMSAFSLFLTGFLDDRVWALICMMIFASLHFFVPVICSRTIQIRAAQHSHFALNLNMVIAGIAQILIPLGVQAVVPDNSREQWALVFYFLVITIVITSVLYTVFSRVSPAEWTNPKKKSEYTIYRLSDISPPEPITIPMPRECKY